MKQPINHKHQKSAAYFQNKVFPNILKHTAEFSISVKAFCEVLGQNNKAHTDGKEGKCAGKGSRLATRGNKRG